MKTEELYDKITALVPHRAVSVNDFRNALHNVLEEYKTFVEEYFETEEVGYSKNHDR